MVGGGGVRGRRWAGGAGKAAGSTGRGLQRRRRGAERGARRGAEEGRTRESAPASTGRKAEGRRGTGAAGRGGGARK